MAPLDFLKALTAAPSPSGHERLAQAVWCEYVRHYAPVHMDAYGNATTALHGRPKVMLDAHIDEIGLIVKHIDDGFIYFQPIGDVSPALIRGKRVDIHTPQGPVRGVVGAPNHNLREKDEDDEKEIAETVPKFHECFIDVGANWASIEPGQPITFTDGLEIVDGYAIGRGLDNRLGAWVIAQVMRRLSEKPPECGVYACTSVQEEVTFAGARMQVERVRPDMALVVDLTHATDTPGVEVKQHGDIRLGRGPVIAVGPECHPALVKRLRRTAEDTGPAYQIEAASETCETDISEIYPYLGGIPSASIYIPCRYLHSTVEMVSMADVQATINLLAAFLWDISAGERLCGMDTQQP